LWPPTSQTRWSGRRVAAGGGHIDTVVHTAGVIDDGAIEALTPDRIDRCWRPSRRCRPPGRGVAARAAGVVLLVVRHLGGSDRPTTRPPTRPWTRPRRPGAPPARTSPRWRGDCGRCPVAMTGALTVTDRARLARGGIVPMDTEEALELLDAALAVGEPVVVAARLDLAALRAAAGRVPSVLNDLAPSPTVGPRTRAPRRPTRGARGRQRRRRPAARSRRADAFGDPARAGASRGGGGARARLE